VRRRAHPALAITVALSAIAAGCGEAVTAAPPERPATAAPARSAPVALVPDAPGHAVVVEAPPGGRARFWLRVANGGDRARALRLRTGSWLRAPAAVEVPPRQSVPVAVAVEVPRSAPAGEHPTVVAARAEGDPAAAVPVSYESAVRVTIRVAPGGGR
jgi:hypothetical protein